MADNFIHIRINSQADNGGFESANKKLGELKESARSFVDTLKLGVGIDFGHRIVESIAEIPRALQEAIRAGVEFNAVLETARFGVAGVLRQFGGEQIGSFNDALKTSDSLIDTIKAKAMELGLDFEGFLESYKNSAGSLFHAGVSDLEKQVDLIAKLQLAMSAHGITGFQAQRDTMDILNGAASRTMGGRALGLEDAELKEAKERGETYAFILEKIKGSSEAGAAATHTFTAELNRFKTEVLTAEGEIAQPVFEAIKQAVSQLNQELKNSDVVNGLREIGVEIGALVEVGSELIAFAIRHAEVFKITAGATALLSVALAGMKITQIVQGLGIFATELFVAKTAVERETVALAENTAAQNANAAAAARAGAARAGSASASGGAGAATRVSGMLGAVGMGVTAGLAIDAAMLAYADHKVAVAMTGNQSVNAFAKELDTLREQITAADTLEKKEAARKALAEALVDKKNEAGIADEENQGLLHAQVTLLEKLGSNFDKLAGKKAAALHIDKATSEEAQKQADAAAALSAHEELSFKILQAKADGNEQLVKQLEEQQQLEADIAGLMGKYGKTVGGSMAADTARQIAGEMQAARRGVDARQFDAESTRLTGEFDSAGADRAAKPEARIHGLFEDYWKATGFDRASMPMSERDPQMLFDVAKSGQSEKGMEIAIKIKEALAEQTKEQQRQTEEQEKKNEAAEKWRQKGLETIDRQKEEFAIERARISGNEQLAQQLEHQRDVRREIVELMNGGVEDYEQARALAEESVTLKERLAQKKAAKPETETPYRAGDPIYAGARHTYDIAGRESYDPAQTGELSATYQTQLSGPQHLAGFTGSGGFNDWFHNSTATGALAGAMPDGNAAQKVSGGADSVGNGAQQLSAAGQKLQTDGGKLAQAATELTATVGTLATKFDTVLSKISSLQSQIENLRTT